MKGKIDDTTTSSGVSSSISHPSATLTSSASSSSSLSSTGSANLKPTRKLSITMIILAGCLLGATIGLFGLNFWHASRCTINSHTQEEMEEYLESVTKRLLNAESQTLKNGLIMDKLIYSFQSHLYKLETKELDELSERSQDEAVKIALQLASQPAPPMVEYVIDPMYLDAEILADAIDSALGHIDDEEKENRGNTGRFFGGTRERGDDNEKDDDLFNTSKDRISDAEAIKICGEWKSLYSVIKGVSWGNLPYDLQKKWVNYNCDYHLSDTTDGVA